MVNATGLPSQMFIDLSCTIRNFFDFIFFASTAIYYRVMLSRKVFHMNLFTILLFYPWSFIVILLPNILKDSIQWFTRVSDTQSVVIMMIVDIGQFSTGYNLLVLVSERLIATYYVASYENMCAKVPWFAVGLVCIQWTASSVLLYLNYYGEYVSSIALVMSIFVGCAIATLVFSLLPRVSNKVYNREFSRTAGSVTRYQSVENIRSAKVLRRLVLSTVASVALMLAIYCYIRFFITPKMRPPFFNLHFTVVAVCATLLNFVVLTSHDTLFNELLMFTRTERLFAKFKSRKGSAKVFHIFDPDLDDSSRRNGMLPFEKKDSTTRVRSINGSCLDVPRTQETAAYFQAYRNIWNQ